MSGNSPDQYPQMVKWYDHLPLTPEHSPPPRPALYALLSVCGLRLWLYPLAGLRVRLRGSWRL